MKKFIGLVLILAIVCTSMLSLAEEGNPLLALYNAEESILFHTDNVTMTGSASFSIDGFVFKRAYLTHVQDGISAVRQWVVYTPEGENRSVCRVNGFTIMSQPGRIEAKDARWREKLQYVLEPECQKTTILRGSVAMDALLVMSRAAVEAMQLPAECVTSEATEAGTHITVKLQEEQMPALAQAALNLLVQYGIEQYYDMWIDYSGVRVNAEYGSMVTFAEEIVYNMDWVRLTKLDLTADLLADGSIGEVIANVTLMMTDHQGNDHEIEVSLSQNAQDYGTSRVMSNFERYDRWYSTYVLMSADSRYEEKALAYFRASDPVFMGQPVTDEMLCGYDCYLVDLSEEGHMMYVIDTLQDSRWYIVMNTDDDLTLVCVEESCG